MNRFFPEPLIANDISRFFARIYYVKEMSKEERTSIFSEIRSEPQKYIVKPQKEGGGNNYYNEEILKLLPAEDQEIENLNPELNNSLIMQRISPPESDAYVLHENKLKKIKGISEVSIYGIVISSGDKKILLNQNAGYLVRTKDKNVQEGGIVAGFSAVDLPYLVDFNLKDNCALKYD
jgi:glutathione synthase